MNYAVVLAGGIGTRFSYTQPKQFVSFAGSTLIGHVLHTFDKSMYINKIIIVIAPECKDILDNILLNERFKKIYKVVIGGKSRQESSRLGIAAIDEQNANVFFHDVARPLVSQKIIERCALALTRHKAVVPVVPATDTLVQTSDNKSVLSVVDRKHIYQNQTPQCFRLDVIKRAFELSGQDGGFTDECSMILKHKLCEVHMIQGDRTNIKVTFPEDIYVANALYNMKVRQR